MGDLGNYPNVWHNNLWWWSNDTYVNGGGQWNISLATWPIAWNGNKPTVAGRYAQVVLCYDFVKHVRSSWYDGALVDKYLPLDIPAKTWIDMVFEYEQTQPFKPGSHGRPAYIDDLFIGWDLL